MSIDKTVHPYTASAEEDEQEHQRCKKARWDKNGAAAPATADETTATAPIAVPSEPLHANMYMNSLANEGTRSLVNCGCLALRDIVNDGIATPEKVLLANYMIDMAWVPKQCTVLGNVPTIDIVHGGRGDSKLVLADQVEEFRSEHENCHVSLHLPPLPFQYGTFHAKFILMHIANPSILRVAITTANFLYGDWWHKNQMTWVQDFLPKPSTPEVSFSATNDFAGPFVSFLKSCLSPQMQARWIPLVETQFDLSTATVDLVPSVPGYHRDSSIHRYGHPRLSRLLRLKSQSAPACHLIAQFSSMGSLQEKWLLDEFKSCLSSNRAVPKPKSQLHLIFPTVEEVRNSREGWMGGGSLPVSKANWKPFIVPLLRSWGTLNSSRASAMPHIKTYLRYREDPKKSQTSDVPINEIDFIFCGSHNLSKAAWGEYQKDKSQLFMRSYELGVLLTPSSISQFKPFTPPFISPPLKYFSPIKTPKQQTSRCGFFWTYREIEESKMMSDPNLSESKSHTLLPQYSYTGNLPSHPDSMPQSSPHPSSSPNRSPTGSMPNSPSSQSLRTPAMLMAVTSESDPSASLSKMQQEQQQCIYWMRLPYVIPPKRYTSNDAPWNVTDSREGVPDILGLTLDEAL